MLIKIKDYLTSYVKDYFSWKTDRKIVVIESDDWGSIRMPCRRTYDALLTKGLKVDQDHYCKYDALESEEDLTMLFETLMKYKDKHGKPAVFTANCLMANPDFDKIRKSNFTQFHYQSVADTFCHYPKHQRSLMLWKEGYRQKVFHPQSHGREHVNVARWMHALRENYEETRLAFDYKLFGIGAHISSEKRASYMEALAAETVEDALQVHKIVCEGLDLFEQLLGFRSKTFIAPSYCWSTDLESTLFKQGVKYIQGNRFQFETLLSPKRRVLKKPHYSGERNKHDQVFLVRNCYFEPSFAPGKDWVGTCLKQIADSFKAKRPAIVAAHRVNFIGFIDPENRTANLKKLATLLNEVQRHWPDVEFLSSDELGNSIHEARLRNFTNL